MMSDDELQDLASRYYDRDLNALVGLLSDFSEWHSSETFKQHYEQLQEAVALAILILKVKSAK